MNTQKETEIVNAKIDYTKLGPGANDGRGFGCWIGLDYGNSGQAFGGYSLTSSEKKMRDDAEDEWDYDIKWVGTAWGMAYIAQLLDAVGVDQWEDLKKKYVRVKREKGWGGRILAIGHIVEDKWFEPEQDLKDYFKEDGIVR